MCLSWRCVPETQGRRQDSRRADRGKTETSGRPIQPPVLEGEVELLLRIETIP